MNPIFTISITSLSFIVGLMLGLYFRGKKIVEIKKRYNYNWVKLAGSYRGEITGLLKQNMELKEDILRLYKLITTNVDHIDKIFERRNRNGETSQDA